MAGENPAQQPRGGPGVAEVEYIVGLPATPDAKSPDTPGPRVHSLDPRTERPQCGRRRENVLPLQ